MQQNSLLVSYSGPRVLTTVQHQQPVVYTSPAWSYTTVHDHNNVVSTPIESVPQVNK